MIGKSPHSSSRANVGNTAKGQNRCCRQLGFACVVVVLQKTELVETEILFTTISIPRAALLFGTLVSGFVIGVLTGGRIMARVKKE